MNNDWISVADKMPDESIRVWGSTGPSDIGNDVYFGHKPASLLESFRTGYHDFGTKCWRYTHDSSEVKHPILFWMPLPDSPH